MRRSFDGLMAAIRDTCQMGPYADALYLFCGRKRNTLKALYFGQTGLVLCTKRLDNGASQWPRGASQARQLTRQQLRWPLEGLSICQPNAVRPSGRKGFYFFVHYAEF